MTTVFTIGHSTHPIEAFVELLRRHGVTALADIRSVPRSRFNPQFNREALAQSLEAHGITYVFLGQELGGRPEDPALYLDGKVQYAWVAKTEAFQFGIARVVHGAEEFTLALMCAEKDPAGCHRARLVAPALAREGVVVRHILADGTIESHEELVLRMGVAEGS
jgi:uncharacterized protein (DUF488 family)